MVRVSLLGFDLEQRNNLEKPMEAVKVDPFRPTLLREVVDHNH